MAVVASGAVPLATAQKAGPTAAPAPGTHPKACQPESASADASTSAAAAQPAPAEAAHPAAPAEVVTTAAVGTGEHDSTAEAARRDHHQESLLAPSRKAAEPQSASTTSAAPPPLDGASRDAAAEPSADAIQACSSKSHAHAAAQGNCGADAAADRSSSPALPAAAAAAAASALTAQAVKPVENSMPKQGQVTTLSGQSSTGVTSEAGAIASALARSAAPSTDVPMPAHVNTES